eukprot:4295758-Amphidinium_carterae.1
MHLRLHRFPPQYERARTVKTLGATPTYEFTCTDSLAVPAQSHRKASSHAKHISSHHVSSLLYVSVQSALCCCSAILGKP